MTGTTNKGKRNILGLVYNSESAPTNFYAALCTDAVAPTADTNTLSELTEVSAGNGYTSGGILLDRNTTDFDVITEDDAGDTGDIQIRDLVWTASGGSIDDIRYLVLTDDNATIGDREVWHYWDLGLALQITDGNDLTLIDFVIRLSE